LADLETRGFRLAQAVLDESAGRQAGRDLKNGGMPRVTELLYLERDTATPMQELASISAQEPVEHMEGQRTHARLLPERSACSCLEFQWQPFSIPLESEFRSVLQATYTGSLDMPELEGIRSLDDILGGHKAAGRFVAERWWLGRVRGKPELAAVLLMAEVPGRDVWEVIYLGLTPQARGHGLGRAVLRHALELARPRAAWLELAVDLRNTPALRLYKAAGFVARDRRAVHLVTFPTAAVGETVR
jgi:ribosomal protein S18 acetylase RimI-like enzyme